VGSVGGGGGCKVFWVDQRVVAVVARQSFCSVGNGGSEEADRRFLLFELWTLSRITEVSASAVGWRLW
jgi:hypothetical protein